MIYAITLILFIHGKHEHYIVEGKNDVNWDGDRSWSPSW